MSAGAARRVLNQSIRNGSVGLTKHAEEEMFQDDITLQEVFGILQKGRILEPEWEQGSWRYRIVLQSVWVVIAFRENIRTVVITAWRKKR
jgi:hypothetical protein